MKKKKKKKKKKRNEEEKRFILTHLEQRLNEQQSK